MQEKKLIKAHIIPESLFEPLVAGPLPLEIRTNTPGKYTKKAPIGIYDSTIVCEECERLFSPWDDYAQSILLKKYPDEAYVFYKGQKLALKLETIDYAKLKLFFISLLWRASVSKQEFFARVNIGPFEIVLRELLLSKAPGEPENFAVTISKFEDPLGTIILDPHRDRFDGINYIRFYLAGYIAYIKVDNRRSLKTLGGLKLSAEQPLFIILRDFKKSKELSLIQKILLNSK